VPEAPLPSPYEMSQVAPSYSSQVSLLLESKAEWSPRWLEERAVLKTHLSVVSTYYSCLVIANTYRSAEPVSKFKLSCWPPMVTGERYSDSFSSG
jgi:hypothetical protein